MEDNHIKVKKTRIFLLAAAGFFALIALITGIFYPDAEFDWFFGHCRYWGGSIILCLVALVGWIVIGGENRDAKLYLTSTGDLDFSTPREYTELQKSAVAKWLGRTAKWTSKGLSLFSFKDGNVRIITTTGDMIEGPLHDLTVRRSFTKNNNTGKVYPYKYVISDQNGNELLFYLNENTFEENEWNDIHLILEQAGTVNEPKMSKLLRKSDRFISALEDFDYSDLLGSSVEALASIVTVKADGPIANNIKANFIKEQKRKSGWRKWWDLITSYSILAILGLYLLIVILYNLVTFPAWNHPEGDRNGDQFAMFQDAEDSEEMYEMEEGNTEAAAQEIHLNGIVNGEYRVEMWLDMANGTGTGVVYIAPAYDTRLVITKMEDRDITIDEYFDDTLIGRFEGKVVDGTTINGWYTDSEGNNMPFSLDVDTPDKPTGLLSYIASSSVQKTYDDKTAYFYKGNFISGSKKYPVMIAFINDGGNAYAVYKNVAYGGDPLKMKITDMSDDSMTLENSSNNFSIELEKSYEGELTGEATQGKTTLRVQLSPTFDTF